MARLSRKKEGKAFLTLGREARGDDGNAFKNGSKAGREGREGSNAWLRLGAGGKGPLDCMTIFMTGQALMGIPKQAAPMEGEGQFL